MKQTIEKLLKETPSLKGKEIAKKIGEDKKAVNSFLYAHKDDFVQDNNYCWSLLNHYRLAPVGSFLTGSR